MSMSDQGSILVVDDEPHVSEMLEEYFAEPLDGSLPIVMLSGYAAEDMARRVVAAGALQYLQKPFDFDGLSRTIVEAIEAGREHRSADVECVAR